MATIASQTSTDTRQRIIDASFQLFTEKSIDATSTREIAQRASVNEVTLFRHFGNKSGLIQAVIEHFIPSLTLPRLGELNLTDNLEHNLQKVTQLIIQFHQEREDFFRFIFVNLVQHPENQAFIQRIQTPLHTWMTKFLQRYCPQIGIDYQAFALEFIAPIIIHSIQRVFLKETLPTDSQFIQMHTKVFYGAIQHLSQSEKHQ